MPDTAPLRRRFSSKKAASTSSSVTTCSLWRGEPGDDVYLFLSRGTSFRYVSGFRGVQLTKQPGPPVHLGVVPQNGVLNPHYDMPDLGGSVQSRTYYFQAALRDPQGVWTFTSPVSLVVLDQAF